MCVCVCVCVCVFYIDINFVGLVTVYEITYPKNLSVLSLILLCGAMNTSVELSPNIVSLEWTMKLDFTSHSLAHLWPRPWQMERPRPS